MTVKEIKFDILKKLQVIFKNLNILHLMWVLNRYLYIRIMQITKNCSFLKVKLEYNC